MSIASSRALRQLSGALALVLSGACRDDAGSGVNGVALAPEVEAQLLAFDGRPIFKPGAQSYRSGASLQMRAGAELYGHGRITWIGLHVSSPVEWRDSIPVPDSLGRELSAELSLAPPQDYVGDVHVSFFARTSAGMQAEVPLQNGPATMFRDVARSFRTVTLPEYSTEVRLDPQRNVLYVLQWRARRIVSVSLDNLAVSDLVAFPDTIGSFDVTTDGRTLVATVPKRNQLAIADLTANPVSVRFVDLVMPVHELPGFAHYPARLRVANNGRVLITLGFNGHGATPLLEYNLHTGTQGRRVRPDSQPDGMTTGATLERSFTGSRIILSSNYLAPALSLRSYDASTDQISGNFGSTEPYWAAISMDSLGANILYGATFLRPGVPQMEYYAPAEMAASTISLDGRTVFSRGATGLRMSVIRMNPITGAVQEDIPLTSVPIRLVALPGGRELLVMGGNGMVTLIDLEGPGTAPAVRSSAAVEGTSWRLGGSLSGIRR